MFVEKIFGKGMEIVGKNAASLYNQIAGAKKWEKAFTDVAEFSEYVTKESCSEISKHYTMLRFYFETFDKKYNDFPKENFIIALAMELNDYNVHMNANNIVAIADAYIDNWRNEVLKQDGVFAFKDTCLGNEIKEINRNDVLEIIDDKEKLIKAFFKGCEDKEGTHIIRVYYPEQGKSWLESNTKYSIEIKANLNKGMPLGFCRVGYDYSLIHGDIEDGLKVAYLSNKKDREILRINRLECPDFERIIWAK